MNRKWKIGLIIAALVILLVIMTRKISNAATLIDQNFSGFAESAASSYGVPIVRIKAMIYQESGGDETAIGCFGERGLMQIEPGALSDFNAHFGGSYTFDQLFDPEININVGAGYLAILARSLNGDIDKATQAYNAGIGNVKMNPSAGLAYLNSVKAKEEFFL